MDPILLFTIIILILSVIVHEAAHGYAANWLGDPTARLAGRLTLNPIPHIDPLGSIIIPGILVLTGASFFIGWAKPVPYNPYNLRNQRWGEAMVAGAGPLVNIFLALVFGVILRFADSFNLSQMTFQLLAAVVYINILLALFNLIPIPPLDGSKLLKSVLPWRAAIAYQKFEGAMLRYGFVAVILFLLIFIHFLWPYFIGVLSFIFQLITGMSL